MTDQKKILFFNELLSKVEELKGEGKKIVQSHGIFDLIHPGIIKHLNEAKEQGDILIVTVIKDKDVRKGPGRPIFPDKMRLENVSSLEQVDYVCLVDDETPFSCIKSIKPDVFAKGRAYKELGNKIYDKIFEEEKDLYFEKSRIYETRGFSFSSSEIINKFLDIYPDETKAFLKDFSNKYSFDEIVENLNTFKKLNVLVIGDGIIDEYHYCQTMGKSAKSPIVVNKYITHEVFAGGAFIIANHLAGLCDNVHLVTLLGSDDSKKEFVNNNLKSNITTKFFYRNDGPTICKKRYIDQYLNQKLFEINYLNNNYIDADCEFKIINHLKSSLPAYDLVLVSDFGHGFITDKIIEVVESFSKVLAVNTQTNSANSGYNMITKYRKPNFVCLDEIEARLATQDRFGEIDDIAKKLSKTLNTDCIIITLGRKGSIGINRNGEIKRTPIFSTKVVDTVGAGDAFFAFSAPCFGQGLSLDFISFIGNAVGALAVQIVGNKKPVEKYELLEFINTMLR